MGNRPVRRLLIRLTLPRPPSIALPRCEASPAKQWFIKNMAASLPAIEAGITRAYFGAMRMRSSIARKVVALLAAVILVLATEPAAFAMPAPHSATMQTMHCTSDGMACCDHSTPVRGMPCNHMAICLGMLNCLAMAIVPVDMATASPVALTLSPFWHLREAGSGITLQPDNPPPIS